MTGISTRNERKPENALTGALSPNKRKLELLYDWSSEWKGESSE